MKDHVYCNQEKKKKEAPYKFICTKCGGRIVLVDLVWRKLEILTADLELGEVLEEKQDTGFGFVCECEKCEKCFEDEALRKMEGKVGGTNAKAKRNRKGKG
jgi:hypothetical protein